LFGGTEVGTCTGTGVVGRFSLTVAAIVGGGVAVAVAPTGVVSIGDSVGVATGDEPARNPESSRTVNAKRLRVAT
jgi:hypothetical protein